ncbi:putative Signal recognition particle receptor subunit beta [Hypsibius exemplaris]|uniref:Signal recognition particle receptor subunit beta n=1 Tax=Hypsibius exemplaris TaxID=2072580 RepID=A0A9X6RKU7_HYPEX|nr:putative Signal recognition particle receptor subunit beta [Hypsibius exemplaris]
MSSSGGTGGPADATAPSTLLYSISLLLFVGIAGLIFYFLIRKQSRKLQYVLLLGRNGAGKTALFVKLTQDRSVLTVSSLVQNVGLTKDVMPRDSGREVQLIDIPGFERIRWDVWETNKGLSKGVIFVVDSVTIGRDSQECADILYRILTDPEIQRRHIPILVVCNKQDEVTAKDVEVVSDILEKELNSIRITKYNPTTKKGNKSEFLGKVDQDFTFLQLRGNKVSFAKCTARSDDPDGHEGVEAVVDFLRTLA